MSLHTVLVNKVSSSTCGLLSEREVKITTECEARVGNVVVVQALEEKRVYNTVELTTGRMAVVSKDDVVAGALGERRALRGFVGHCPKEIAVGQVIHILNLGGVMGVCTSANKDVGDPLKCRVLGMAVAKGKIVNIAEKAIPPSPALGDGPPIVMVSGTCMNAGKTQAACEILAKLNQRGYRLGGVKVSGVACLKDTLNMEDHGALATLSFLDCGHPSTAGFEDLAPMAKGLLRRLAEGRSLDAIVVEMGDGIIGGYGVASIFRDREIMARTRAHVLAANDLVAAWGGKRMMEDLGQRLAVITGPATDNEVGEDYIERELGCPAANARVRPAKLADVVEKAVFPE